MTARVRVLVADDHPLYREGVARAIRDRPDLELVAETRRRPHGARADRAPVARRGAAGRPAAGARWAIGAEDAASRRRHARPRAVLIRLHGRRRRAPRAAPPALPATSRRRPRATRSATRSRPSRAGRRPSSRDAQAGVHPRAAPPRDRRPTPSSTPREREVPDADRERHQRAGDRPPPVPVAGHREAPPRAHLREARRGRPGGGGRGGDPARPDLVTGEADRARTLRALALLRLALLPGDPRRRAARRPPAGRLGAVRLDVRRGLRVRRAGAGRGQPPARPRGARLVPRPARPRVHLGCSSTRPAGRTRSCGSPSSWCR